MKKKLISSFTMILLVGLLFSCSSSNEDNADINESKATFTGTIEKIYGEMALVSIEEGEILKSGNKVDVKLSVANDTTFKIGDKVKVGYDGIVREKHPLGINTIFVELVK